MNIMVFLRSGVSLVDTRELSRSFSIINPPRRMFLSKGIRGQRFLRIFRSMQNVREPKPLNS